jgi:hypothetical protein
MEGNVRNGINNLIDTDLEGFRRQLLLYFVIFFNLLFLPILSSLLLFDSLLLLLNFLRSFFTLFRGFTLFFLFLNCFFWSLLFNCLSNLLSLSSFFDLRNYCFALCVTFVHSLSAFKTFSNLINSTINHINKRLQGIFIERVNFREI